MDDGWSLDDWPLTCGITTRVAASVATTQSQVSADSDLAESALERWTSHGSDTPSDDAIVSSTRASAYDQDLRIAIAKIWPQLMECIEIIIR
jgi:hypothetical protein